MSKYEFDVDCFSKNLKHLLKKNNIKNIDLATHLSVSKSAISNYISGVSVPKLETVAKIAAFFDVNFENLVSKKINTAEIMLGEEGKFIYKIPLFHKQLLSDTIIYRAENYVGIITSPFPVEENSECYAVRAYDNSMKSFGITNKNLVIFKADDEVSDGYIAVVLIKSLKQLYIRSVMKSPKCIKLISDNETNIYKNTKNGCDAVILGKVIISTFYPNEK